MRVVNVQYNGKITHISRSRINYVIEFLNYHPLCIQEGFKFVMDASGFYDHNVKCDLAHPVLNDRQATLKTNSKNLAEKVVHTVIYGEETLDSLPFIETIFFHISRFEEIELKQSRYLENKIEFEKQLLIIKSGLEKTAVVDELIGAFLESLIKKEVKIPRYQALTHDIDFIQKFKSPFSIFRKIAGHFRHRRPSPGLQKLIGQYKEYISSRKDPFDTFDWMLSNGPVEKTIYFLRGGDHKEDNQYVTSNRIYQKAISFAKERGYHIGIHPSYESWNNANLIRRQKERLEDEIGAEVVRSRQHYLNFEIEKTPKLLQTLGIEEDSSLGFTRFTGYRCGTAYPYRLYDFEKEKAFDIIEKPLVFMDVAWLYEATRNQDFDLPDFSLINGAFNFHNSTFDEFELQGIHFKEHYIQHFT